MSAPASLGVIASLIVMLSTTSLAKFGFTEQECTEQYGEIVERKTVEGGVGDEEILHFAKNGIRVTATLYALSGSPRVVMLTYKKENSDESLTVAEVDQLMKNSSRFSLQWNVDRKGSDGETARFVTPDRKYLGWASAAEVQDQTRGPLFADLFLAERDYCESWKKATSQRMKENFRGRQQDLKDF